MQVHEAWMRAGFPAGGPESPKLDTTVAYSARVNNYWQGGKDNFATDRAAADRALAAFPDLPAAVRAGQPWRKRVTRFLVAEGGIRQFLDLGAGLPAGQTIGQLAEARQPGCRTVYVDHDPMVLTHARALLPQPGRSCGFVEADIRDTGKVLAAARVLGFGQPIAVILSTANTRPRPRPWPGPASSANREATCPRPRQHRPAPISQLRGVSAAAGGGQRPRVSSLPFRRLRPAGCRRASPTCLLRRC